MDHSKNPSISCSLIKYTMCYVFYVVVTQYNLAIMNIGSPACGMNAAARSFVRLGLTRGCRVLAIRFGFEGLVQDNVML